MCIPCIATKCVLVAQEATLLAYVHMRAHVFRALDSGLGRACTLAFFQLGKIVCSHDNKNQLPCIATGGGESCTATTELLVLNHLHMRARVLGPDLGLCTAYTLALFQPEKKKFLLLHDEEILIISVHRHGGEIPLVLAAQETANCFGELNHWQVSAMAQCLGEIGIMLYRKQPYRTHEIYIHI
jgi:hypothetical protein